MILCLTYLLPYLFTSWLIYLLVPKDTRSVSRPEVVGGVVGIVQRSMWDPYKNG